MGAIGVARNPEDVQKERKCLQKIIWTNLND